MADSLLKMPRSPDLDSYKAVHSLINVPISGLPLNATELLANALCPSFSHHWPDFACLIWSSPKLDKDISAERLTPPTTTTSPILHIISWHSIGYNLLPDAFLNTLMQKWYKSTRGWGPDALPPNVFNLAPDGLTCVTSKDGTCPTYNMAISSRNALAQPGLLSPTVITVVLFSKCSLTTGNLSTFSLSTENPTPVPHIRIYIHSSKLLGLSTGM